MAEGGREERAQGWALVLWLSFPAAVPLGWAELPQPWVSLFCTLGDRTLFMGQRTHRSGATQAHPAWPHPSCSSTRG